LILAIQYLPYQQINKDKWDSCISAAGNGLIYGHSFYLDAMAKQWDGLVLNDYEAVMPLTWNKKYGIHYLYQPPFSASLGVFGNDLSAELVNDFLRHIPEKFRYWDIYLNHDNFFELTDFNLYQRMNYILDLGRNYDSIADGYRENIKRNIKKSEQSGNTIQKGLAIEDVISLAKEQSRQFAPDLTDKDFDNFKQLSETLFAQEKAVTYAVHSATGELMASCIFFIVNDRAFYILPGNHPNGKTLGASHALIDAFIKDYAGQNMLLDFEGSDISSLAFFYSSFGAVEEKYSAIKLNRLPVWAKWLKK
jgi:Acetyltransferase (GNAT) domain